MEDGTTDPICSLEGNDSQHLGGSIRQKIKMFGDSFFVVELPHEVLSDKNRK